MNDSPLRIVPPPSAPPDQPAEPATPPAPDELAELIELAELRRLLFEPEQVQLNNVLERLNNPRARAREQSRTLPEAVRLRNAQDDALQEALAPTVVTALHNSVKKDPRPLAEAIAPLLGPAIRRALKLALSQLTQALDQTLKHGLSWQGWKWRLEGLRTGQSFADVVLYHTLVYRVEQVFLIHKQTGVMLHHVAARNVIAQDGDTVSAMFTAIQDFVGDAFGEQQDSVINTLSVGDCRVWVETGARAYLAAVLRGHAPESLRAEYLEPAISAIHYEQQEAFDAFDGDVAPFEASRPHLESCLQEQYQGKTAEASPRARIFLALLVVGLGLATFFAARSYWRWDSYLDRLRDEPGVLVVDARWRLGWPTVTGLRDPLAADPAVILSRATKLDPAAVTSRWEPYQALHPKFMLARAELLLAPPATVSLKLEDGVLIATGNAPVQWGADARRLWRALPGVTDFRADGLVNADLQASATAIEGQVLRFITGTSRLINGQAEALRQMTTELQRLLALAAAAGHYARVEVIGHTDTEGTEAGNLRLSQERAAKIISTLTAQGINRSQLSAIGVGSSAPVRAEGSEGSEADKQFNRSVSFKVVLTAPARQ